MSVCVFIVHATDLLGDAASLQYTELVRSNWLNMRIRLQFPVPISRPSSQIKCGSTEEETATVRYSSGTCIVHLPEINRGGNELKNNNKFMSKVEVVI